MSKDANHATIEREFRLCGATVVSLHTLGKGVPDLLVGFAGLDQLVEVKLPTRTSDVGKKSPRTQLSNRQRGWHHSWLGREPVVVRTTEDVEKLLDAMAAGFAK